ncbi:TetR/AcrR family transcriptional regulator [Lentzea sp. NPDC058450]|uniref:TetR/AcrR family transcriptional regulator n=1 Tax=Lentzea sp. NPDC058450 TaxID=3346505 RepID=UPI00364BB6FE
MTVKSSNANARANDAAAGRRELLRATTRVVAAGGLRALTYRSVAAEAGVSHSLVQHHFGTLDKLISETMRDVLDRVIEAGGLRSPSSDIADFSAELDASVEAESDSQRFLSEMIVEAARRPELRPLIGELYAELRRSTLAQLEQRGIAADPGLVDLVVAALDGLVFHQLAFHDRDTTRRALARLRELLAALTADHG